MGTIGTDPGSSPVESRWRALNHRIGRAHQNEIKKKKWRRNGAGGEFIFGNVLLNGSERPSATWSPLSRRISILIETTGSDP